MPAKAWQAPRRLARRVNVKGMVNLVYVVYGNFTVT